MVNAAQQFVLGQSTGWNGTKCFVARNALFSPEKCPHFIKIGLPKSWGGHFFTDDRQMAAHVDGSAPGAKSLLSIGFL